MYGIDTSVPHISRVYDYWLGGKDNFAADRELGERTIQVYPDIVHSVRANRAFLARSVRFLAAEQGVRQFLDIGTGLPTAPNVHEIAQDEAPGSRIVYADSDQVVITHARALLRSTPQGALAYLNADLRDPERILAEAAKTLDFGEPVAILLLTVLQFLPGDEAGTVVRRLVSACAPGSFLVISHPASDIDTDRYPKMVQEMNASLPQPATLRDHAAVTRMFGDLGLADPGVVKASQWRPESSGQAQTPTVLWAGVASKTSASSGRPAIPARPARSTRSS